jgi:seryl-tRNA synthetase
MLAIQFIRENLEAVRKALADRHTEAPLDDILRLDDDRRRLLQEVEGLRAERNAAGKRIGAASDPAERQRMIEEMRGVSERIDALEPQLRETEERLERLLLEVPNLPDASVPLGADEDENVVVRSEGEPPAFDFEPLPHWDLGERLGIIDFERGVKLSGSRFYVLKGAGARLQHALIAYMLDLHISQHGYTEVYPPFVECMWGSAQLPKFADNLYHDVEDDLWLVPTAEVPLTNLHRDEILTAETLPLRYVAYTPCFRREKMKAGRDVRGIKRGHQFDKVELYTFCAPQESDEQLERMVRDGEDVCRGLGIPHRLLQQCTGDLGFACAKSYDIEMWAPGCREWLEVSSLSNCTDFQARRASIRFRPEPDSRPDFVHTLNGSGLALPRVLAALLETYQQPDGSVMVPEALRPYVGSLECITPPG